MTTLITGGTGFIGLRLALARAEAGERVRVLALANNSSEDENLRLLQSRGVEAVVGSVTDAREVAAAVEGAKRVFHLAAAQHEANVPDRHFHEVNVEGTRNLLEASVAAGVGRFVHGSTIGVYGAAMEGEITEETAPRPTNVYGVTKREGEKVALGYRDRLPVTVIRISETYGPHDRRLLKLFRAVRSKAFFMIGDGRNQHQLIYVDDLVAGLGLAAEAADAVGEVYNLAGAEILTTDEMVAAVAAAVGASPPRLRLPLWPFSVAAVVFESACRPFGIQPPLHRRRLDFFRKSFYFDRSRARTRLGFEPATGFARGVELTAAWYRENGLLD